MSLYVALIAACALFVGCRTTAELEAERDAEFQTLVGGSMADFMRRTGLMPSAMYPTRFGLKFEAVSAAWSARAGSGQPPRDNPWRSGLALT